MGDVLPEDIDWDIICDCHIGDTVTRKISPEAREALKRFVDNVGIVGMGAYENDIEKTGNNKFSLTFIETGGEYTTKFYISADTRNTTKLTITYFKKSKT